jgi:ribosome biogenesis GTPase A
MACLLKFPNLKTLRLARCYGTIFKTKLYVKTSLISDGEAVNKLIKKWAPKLIYNSVIEKKILKIQHNSRSKKSQNTYDSAEPLPISLKYISDEITCEPDEITCESDQNLNETVGYKKFIDFPYDKSYSVCETETLLSQNGDNNSADVAAKARDEVQKRYELQKELKNWMVTYDNYDDSCLSEENENLDMNDWRINYGTPDPKTEVSHVPCGGCGALLHCKDTAIPGYIPSEIFKNRLSKGGAILEAIVCQRCHFLKSYNLALQVQVTPEDYPKVLSTISEKQGLVILMVDLLDFPCSIWPGIGEIFGSKTPIIVVGNKVDLLPQDNKAFLQHVKMTLLNSVKLQGFATFNIKDVALISAKTGFGVEELITRLYGLYQFKGDVYIVGCTNVGKSTLFNAFLQSDYCKTQAVDLIQRATTSVWPGTTLNLLKFPIKRPAGFRQYLRHKRLEIMQQVQAEESRLRKEQLRVTQNPKYASLMGHIDITRNPYTQIDEPNDLFGVQGNANEGGMLKMGINERSMEYAFSKWCYDTPGVVQPDQIIHLLTTEELVLTLPKELILPRTFCIKPNSTVFIGGLARLDYIDGSGSVRLTIFSAKELPITVCDTQDAKDIYQELLGSDLFNVPKGNNERISKWPGLELAKNFTITGEIWHKSSNDVVMSSAGNNQINHFINLLQYLIEGWIAVAGRKGLQYKFAAWTPEKRGVYIRECLLPHAVSLMGKRIKRSVAYNKFKFYLK